jgi:hypothetical protein
LSKNRVKDDVLISYSVDELLRNMVMGTMVFLPAFDFDQVILYYDDCVDDLLLKDPSTL